MANRTLAKTIKNRNREFMTRFNHGSAEGVSQLFSIDAKILPPNADSVTGRDAIIMFWQAVMEMGIDRVELSTVEIEHHGNIAIEIGNLLMIDENKKVVDRSKYMVIWKHRNGEWKLHRDMYNSSIPHD